jgi:hypothetical protein
MAKTLKKIVDLLVEELQQYKPTDDFPITKKIIIDKVNDARAAIIKREFDQSGKVNASYYQSICCNEIKCITQGCTLYGEYIPSGEVIWYVDLPSLINTVGELNLLYIGPDDYKRNWSLLNFQSWMNVSANLATGHLPAGTLIGSRIYLKNLPTQGITFICIMALLYNPTTACNWKDDSIYPAPDDLTIQTLVKKDINSVYPILPDNDQDSRNPDITQQARPQPTRQNETQQE